MGKSSDGISGSGIALMAGGSILLWSALKGRKMTGVLRELIGGKQPTDTNELPINSETFGATPSAGGGAGASTARASSFTGLLTASGRPMSGDTIASPYLPLGTKITVTYNGKTVNGTVWDFGPADWVMKQDPTRFLDLSTTMMKTLTGKADNLITVNYTVTHYGTGRIYRPGHMMTAQLKNQWGTK